MVELLENKIDDIFLKLKERHGGEEQIPLSYLILSRADYKMLCKAEYEKYARYLPKSLENPLEFQFTVFSDDIKDGVIMVAHVGMIDYYLNK